MSGCQLSIALSPMTCSRNGEKEEGLILMVKPARYMPDIYSGERVSAHQYRGSPGQCRLLDQGLPGVGSSKAEPLAWGPSQVKQQAVSDQSPFEQGRE